MTKLSEVDKEVEELIATNGVRGAEVVIGALVRAMKSRDAFYNIGAGAYGPTLVHILVKALRKESEEGNA